MPKHSLDSLCNLIESLDLFYVNGPLLFIHAYPTVEFLRALLHYKVVTGKHLNSFNTDHYKKAFKSVEALNQYSYTKGGANKNYLLYDPENIDDYYRKNGSVIGSLLTELEIDCIIHGHRPQRSGLQSDHEFNSWIPEIRMIGNDTKVKQQGIGATLVRMDLGRATQVIFINLKTANKKTRKKIRYLLRLSAPSSATLHQQAMESQQNKKMKKQIDAMDQKYKNQQLQAESDLQEQRTSHLLLQEELRERDELHMETQEKLKSLETFTQQLENKLQKRGHQQHQQQLTKELPKFKATALPLKSVQQQHKQSVVTTEALETLELSRIQLQQALEKSNHNRRQAVEYLRLSHEANQRLTQDLKHCINEKLEAEKSHVGTLKNVQKQRQPIKQPEWIYNVYTAIISSLLTGVVFFFLF